MFSPLDIKRNSTSRAKLGGGRVFITCKQLRSSKEPFRGSVYMLDRRTPVYNGSIREGSLTIAVGSSVANGTSKARKRRVGDSRRGWKGRQQEQQQWQYVQRAVRSRSLAGWAGNPTTVSTLVLLFKVQISGGKTSTLDFLVSLPSPWRGKWGQGEETSPRLQSQQTISTGRGLIPKIRVL